MSGLTFEHLSRQIDGIKDSDRRAEFCIEVLGVALAGLVHSVGTAQAFTIVRMSIDGLEKSEEKVDA